MTNRTQKQYLTEHNINFTCRSYSIEKGVFLYLHQIFNIKATWGDLMFTIQVSILVAL